MKKLERLLSKFKLSRLWRKLLKLLLVLTSCMVLFGFASAEEYGDIKDIIADEYYEGISASTDLSYSDVASMFSDIYADGCTNVLYAQSTLSGSTGYIFYFFPETLYSFGYEAFCKYYIRFTDTVTPYYYAFYWDGAENYDCVRVNLTGTADYADGAYRYILYSWSSSATRYYTTDTLCSNYNFLSSSSLTHMFCDQSYEETLLSYNWTFLFDVQLNFSPVVYYYTYSNGTGSCVLPANIIEPESTDDVYYDVIIYHEENYLSVGWDSTIAGYMYGGFDSITITVKMTAYNITGSSASFNYTASRTGLSGTVSGISSSGNYYMGAMLSEGVLIKDASPDAVSVVVNSVNVTFGYVDYDYSVSYYHSGNILLFGSLPNSGGNLTMDDTADKAYDNTDMIPDVQVLVNSYLYVSSGFTTYDPQNISFCGWESVLYCTCSDAISEPEVDESLLNALKAYISEDLGGCLETISNFVSSDEPITDDYGSYINNKYLQYYLTTYSSVYDVIIYDSYSPNGEALGYPFYVFYTSRYYIKAQLFNFDNKIDELTKGIVYNYNVSYNMFTYLKYRLDDMESVQVNFFNSALSQYETSNKYLSSINSKFSTALNSLNGVNSAIVDLDGNISAYLYQQTADIVSAINSLDVGGLDNETSFLDKLVSLLSYVAEIFHLLEGDSAEFFNEIDTPQELGFDINVDDELTALTSDIFNGMSHWYTELIRIMMQQNTDDVFDDVMKLIELYDDATDPIYEFFDSDLDLNSYSAP